MNRKFSYKPYFALLFISGIVLVPGHILVVGTQAVTPSPIPTLQSTPNATNEPNISIIAQAIPTATVTPTPNSDQITSGSTNLTPEGMLAVVIITPPSALTPTPPPASGFSVDFSDLTLEILLQSLISIAVVIVVAILGSRLIYLVLRRLVRRTETEFDDKLLETIRPQIIWLLAAMGFQFVTNRAAFISGDVFETIYFLLYWFVAVTIAWRSIDFASIWYLDHQNTEEKKLPESMVNLLKRLSQIILIFIASGILLGSFGVNILAVSAALGLGGFAIALAAKDTIANVISGFVLMFTQPFQIGERIDIPAVGTWADVVEIGMRTTKAITRDNRLVIIPNSLVVDNYVINYSEPDPSIRLQTDIGIGSGENIDELVQVLQDAVRQVEGVLANKNVDVLFTEFGDSSNTFRVRWWVSSYADKRRVTHRVCTVIQEVVTKEGIEMPNPILDTNVMMLSEE